MRKGFGFQWHITNECDQRCKHCYIYGKNPNSQTSYLRFCDLKLILDNIMSFCSKTNVFPYIYLTGGDPLLHPDFWKLLALFYEYRIRFSILGNPFHLDAESCKQLKLFGCERYQMSIDGLEKTHDSIRKSGSFQCTLDKYALLKREGIRTVMMCTVSKDNVNEIPDLVRLAVQNKINNFGFSRYCPSGNQDIEMIGPYEYRDFLSAMWSTFLMYKDSDTLLSLKDHLWTPFLDEIGIIRIPSNQNGCVMDGCNCAISHMTILENGDVYACRRFSSRIGNALSDSFYDLFSNSKINSYRDLSRFVACKDCKYLYYCRGCPAVAACACGSFYAPDPQCWVYEERKKNGLCSK